MIFSKAEDVVRLGTRLEQIDQQCATRGNRTFYLSVSPKFYGSGCRSLADAGLLKDPKRSRVVIEKPFGRDYGSAQALNRVVQACGQENQIFRIDHYLGKETVQNIMVLRFANTIFEPIWNRNYISSVQITAAETVGVEERAGLLRIGRCPAGHGAEPPDPDAGDHRHGTAGAL